MFINIQYLLPEVFLISILLFFIMYGTYYSTLQSIKINSVILSIEFYYFVFIIFFFYLVLNEPLNYLSLLLYSNTLKITISSFLIKKISVLLLLFIFYISFDYLKIEAYNYYEYYVLYLFLILSMVILVYANDFLTLYLGIELQNFIFYILLSSNKYSQKNIEAAVKYFILASIMSIIMVYGISLLYGITGTFNFEYLKLFFILLDKYLNLYNIDTFKNFFFIYIAVMLIYMLFFFKLTIAPFYFWALDIYESISLVNLMLFMLSSKLIFLFLFIKLVYLYFYKIFYMYGNIFFILAIFSIIIGVIGGIREISIKKIYGYSSITNMGFILLSISTNSIEGLQLSFFYFFIYIIMSLLFFIILLYNKKEYNKYFEYITDVKDFVKINKSIAYMFSILLFSLSGIPPLLGFWGKFFILMLVTKYYSFELVLGLLMLSILSMFYYIRFIKIIFFEKTLIYNSFSIITYNKSCFGLFLLFINIFGFYFLDFFLTLSYKIVIYLYI